MAPEPDLGFDRRTRVFRVTLVAKRIAVVMERAPVDQIRPGATDRQIALAGHRPLMVDREASPAHFERPSPDEPWRFACPECGSSSVDALEKVHAKRGHDQFAFYCRGCGQKLEYIVDKKSDTHVYQWHSEHDGD
jgi:transcription elongation factor Elf1